MSKKNINFKKNSTIVLTKELEKFVYEMKKTLERGEELHRVAQKVIDKLKTKKTLQDIINKY